MKYLIFVIEKFLEYTLSFLVNIILDRFTEIFMHSSEIT